MRRFSQRSYLVTLSEINITTPLLEQSINLKLPRGGQPDKFVNKRDIRTVEVSNTGVYALDRQRMSFNQLLAQLAQDFRANPDLIVYIRADQDGPYKNVAAVIDGCQRSGITRYSLRTEPTK
jgi:biopolymer transport protein ExbD